MNTVLEHVRDLVPFELTGRVNRVVGVTPSAVGLAAPVGAVCRIELNGGTTVDAEVVGFRDQETLLLPYGELSGVRRGDRVQLVRSVPGGRVGDRLLGRVVDARGRCLDGGPSPVLPHRTSLHREPPLPLDRPRIDTPLGTGVRAIDGLLTCGKGQRLGIFAGSGVGKSTLLGQMARASTADVNVVVLVGERGREVREFLERDLGPEGLAKSVVVVATGDEPPVTRLRAAFYGTAIAEYFRDSGKDVLLVMDSVTRLALAQREVGLASGEPPATRGYPPSVFALLPRLLERSGRTQAGSITAFYTVLVEGDDTNEPISDTVRGILDGHVVLSRRLAAEAHWPAIDVLASISRSMTDVVSPEHRSASNSIKQLLAAYQRSEDLISVGAYQRGSNPVVDVAIRMQDALEEYLTQDAREHSSFAEAAEQLLRLAAVREQHRPLASSASAAEPHGSEPGGTPAAAPAAENRGRQGES